MGGNTYSASEYSLDLAFSSAIEPPPGGNTQDMYVVGYGWAKCTTPPNVAPQLWEGEAQKAEKIHPNSSLLITLYDGASIAAKSITEIEVVIKSSEFINHNSDPPATPFTSQDTHITFTDDPNAANNIRANPFGSGQQFPSIGCNSLGWVWQTSVLTTIPGNLVPSDIRFVFTVKITLIDSNNNQKIFKVDPKMIVGSAS